MDEKIEIVAAGETPVAVPAVPKATPPGRQYEVDGKDRALLPLAWVLGVALVELLVTCVSNNRYGPGLIVPVMVGLWYGVLFWYRGIQGLADRPTLWMTAAVGLLSLTFALSSNVWFRIWNILALPVLMGVQFFQLSGAGDKAWYLPTMLWERFVLTLDGLFCRLGAPIKALTSLGKFRRWAYVLAGLAVAVPALIVVVPLLTSADALFQHVTGGVVEFLGTHFSTWVGKLLFGLLAAPFLFGLLYAIRRPERRKKQAAQAPLAIDPTAPATVLLVMDALYLFFIAVQFTGLFGGEAYLAAAYISYADYARSGFFQLVTVSVINLTLVMACLQLSRREGRGWQLVRVLSTVLVAASCVMLASAAYRMTLYVTMYGLSFKRFLTYWGMVMLAIFFAAALLKIWKKQFSFFKILFAAGVAGWLVLNFINVDYLVTRYNVNLYRQGKTQVMDLPYLAGLSYDTLSVLEELPGDTQVYHNSAEDYPLSRLLAEQRQAAVRDAAHWQTWTVSAQMAARDVEPTN